jgi:hypothetical protein
MKLENVGWVIETYAMIRYGCSSNARFRMAAELAL